MMSLAARRVRNGLIVAVVGVSLAIGAGVLTYQHQVSECASLGGHLGPNSLCLDSDGRVLR